MAGVATRPRTTPEAPSRASAPGIPWRRQVGIGLALVVCYFLVSLAASPNAHWLTDVGGKSATVEAMVERGDWSTDLGYWAETSDLDGAVYPFIHTQRMPNGWWVNTTSVPLVFAARPLWEIGGPQLALLIPMAFAAIAALAGGAMERRMVGGTGLRSVLVMGLATPVALYALDLWEHSIALALMLLGVNGVLAAIDENTEASEKSRLVALVGAGLAFGTAAVMRQEALVYGFVAGLVMIGCTLRADRRSAPGRVAAMAGTTVAILAANEAFERWYYGGSLRGARSGGVAGQVASSSLDRVQAAIVTAAAPIPSFSATSYLMALLLVGGLVWLTWSAYSEMPLRPATALLAAVVAMVFLRLLVVGPTFVPGLAASTPLAVVGVVAGFRSRRSRYLALALAPMPLVFLTQYLGGTLPQWGGRYLLLSGAVLTVVACAEFPRVHPVAFRAVALAGLCVTGLGAFWYSVRTNSLDTTWQEVASVAGDDVVVWYDPVFARESGAELVGSRWLSTYGTREYDSIGGHLSDLGVHRFVWLSPEDEVGRGFDGFEVMNQHGELTGILGIHATVYERADVAEPADR